MPLSLVVYPFTLAEPGANLYLYYNHQDVLPVVPVLPVQRETGPAVR